MGPGWTETALVAQYEHEWSIASGLRGTLYSGEAGRSEGGGDSRRHGAFVAVRLPRRMYARLRVNDHARMSERAHMQLSVWSSAHAHRAHPTHRQTGRCSAVCNKQRVYNATPALSAAGLGSKRTTIILLLWKRTVYTVLRKKERVILDSERGKEQSKRNRECTRAHYYISLFLVKLDQTARLFA